MNGNTVLQFVRNTIRTLSLPAGDSKKSLPEPCWVIDTIYLVDISDSMNEPDYFPTRLGAAQDAALSLLRDRIATGNKGRLGVGAFNEVGFPICPLTPLDNCLEIENAIKSLKPRGGTNLAAGLIVGETLFAQAESAAMRREIVLLSDGINKYGEDPRHIADRLKSRGCEIKTIGIGGNERSIDEELLKAIASVDATGKPMYRFITDRNGLLRHCSEIGGLTR